MPCSVWLHCSMVNAAGCPGVTEATEKIVKSPVASEMPPTEGRPVAGLGAEKIASSNVRGILAVLRVTFFGAV